MIDEAVSLAEYQHEWDQLAVGERDRLAMALCVPQHQIEHIGSTAVPGLIAKPVIDLMVGLAVVPPDSGVEKMFVGLGYRAHGEAGGDRPLVLYQAQWPSLQRSRGSNRRYPLAKQPRSSRASSA